MATAFFTGLLGSSHCVGMCGGIVGALTMGVDPAVQKSRWRLLPFISAYNAGRLTSYTVAGAIAGLVGLYTMEASSPEYLQPIGKYLSSFFMIALGLYLGGWWMGLAWLEKAGAVVWKRIEPLGRGLLPIRSPGRALLVGLLWGWLPCGLVYAMLTWALVSGGPQQGALIMLAFGVGTLPALMAMGVAGSWLSRAARNKLLRKIAGFIVIAFGIFVLLGGDGHQHQNDNRLQLQRSL
ncbi:MAG: sulfite exporter TauE/SafE family protein [Acidiferrobacterales bacterium]